MAHGAAWRGEARRGKARRGAATAATVATAAVWRGEARRAWVRRGEVDVRCGAAVATAAAFIQDGARHGVARRGAALCGGEG